MTAVGFTGTRGELSPVAGYEDRYLINHAGLVWSVLRGPMRQLKWGKTSTRPSRPEGYPGLKLYNKGHGITYPVHKLVAATFIGPCPPGMEVCHNDGNNWNPALSNLRYGTPEENWADRIAHGTAPQVKITKCPNGHPYAGANLRLGLRPNGKVWRQCVECVTARRNEERVTQQMMAARKKALWEDWEWELVLDRSIPRKEVARRIQRTVAAIDGQVRWRRIHG